MAQEKRDNLGLCNEVKIPFQDFVAGWCSRCFQADCTRSLHGKSRFEHRIENWEKQLFTEVSRLDPTDSRFAEIAAKRFLPVAPAQANVPSAWLDPRDMEPPKEYSIPSPVAPTVPTYAHLASASQPSAEDKPPQAPSPLPEPPSEPMIRNTAVKPRQMIGEAVQNPPRPVLDPWQPKQPLKPGEVLIPPGGRIKLT